MRSLPRGGTVSGRHYIARVFEAALDLSRTCGRAHVMRSVSTGGSQRVTHYPLPLSVAITHADSLNQNDADDIRKYGDVRS